jgi:polynucleotide 5'-hydroxyl-kinase GRC3/NOL9
MVPDALSKLPSGCALVLLFDEFDVLAGEKDLANIVEGNSVPESWQTTVNTVLANENKPAVVMIVGAIDVGKTSFCAYLANMALKKKMRVTFVDADLGQSDLGPPSTIGFSQITRPIRDPFEIEAEDIRFIGVTSPSGALSEVVSGTTKMTEKALKLGAELVIVNTDGWVEGEDAVRYKITLAKRLKPSMLVGIQEQSELTFLLGALPEVQSTAVESSPAVANGKVFIGSDDGYVYCLDAQRGGKTYGA